MLVLVLGRIKGLGIDCDCEVVFRGSTDTLFFAVTVRLRWMAVRWGVVWRGILERRERRVLSLRGGIFAREDENSRKGCCV